MQQGVQTDAAYNIQQCCVRLHVAQLKLCLCLRKRCLPEHRTHCLNHKSSLRYKRTALYSHEHLWDSFTSQTWKFLNWIVLASNTSFIPPSTYLSLIVWGITVFTLQNNIDRESNWNRNQKAKPQNHDTQKSGFSVKRNVHLFMRTSCRVIRRPTHFLLKNLCRKLVKLTNERIVKTIRVEKT